MKAKHRFNVVLKAKTVFLLYRVVKLTLFILVRALWPKVTEIKPEKICIYRIGNVGDIICAIPAIIAIRKAYPQAHITLLTSPGKKGMVGAKELIEETWFIDRLMVYYSDDIDSVGKTIHLIRRLCAESFDLWVELPVELATLKTILRNMLFARLCGAKCAVGYLISTIKLWTREQSNLFKFDNEPERLIKVLKYYGMPTDDRIAYDLPLSAKVKESAKEVLDRHKIHGGTLFGLVTGAKYKANQWPLDYFVEVGNYILDKFPESRIVIFGAAEELERGEYIRKRLNGHSRVINLAGQTSLLELAYLLTHFQLIISNNTGPMHMAALGGTKVIGIFSSAELYGKWFPYGDNCKVLVERADCEGCYYNCINDNACIKAIKPESVKSLIETMI